MLSDDFKIDDNIIMISRSFATHIPYYINIGQKGKIIRSDKNFFGCVKVKLPITKYESKKSKEFVVAGPFELDISTDRIKIDIRTNREDKIKTIIDDC